MGACVESDLLGQDWLAFWKSRDREDAETALAEAWSGRVGRCAGVAPTLRGEMRHWETLLAPVPHEDGTVSQVCAITRDVSAAYHAARELEIEQRRNSALVRAVSQIVWRAKADHKIGGREDWFHFCGLDDAGHVDFDWMSAVHPDDVEAVRTSVRSGVSQGDAYEITYRLRHRSKTWRWVTDRAVPIRDDAGTLVEWVGLIVDIDDQVQRDIALTTSEERLRLCVQAGQVGVWDRDLLTGTVRWSDEMKAMLGLPRETVVVDGLLAAHLDPDDLTRVHRLVDWREPWTSDEVRVTVRIRRHDTGEMRWIAVAGRTFRDQAGRELRRLGTWQDVTDTVLAERKLWHVANHDALTGLANRNLFHSVLDAAVKAVAETGTPFTLLVLDVDELKTVNDTLGHAVGDLILKEVARRLVDHCPPGATSVRLGSDEFAVLLPKLGAAATALKHAEHLAAVLAQPIATADGELRCAVSLGVAICPSGGCAPGDALRNADLALNAAKKIRDGRPSLFTAEMASALLHRAASMRRIEDALNRGAVVPFYQPKIDIATGRIDGFEALLRWHDGDEWRGPGEIADAFDHPRLAPLLGERILAEVTADLRRWRQASLPVGRIAFNMSAVEFQSTDVSARLLSRLAAAGLEPQDLELEVTESVVLGARGTSVETTLRALSQAGLSVALDDFGTGYASLTHLRQYPFDWLKIERSFVRDMECDKDAVAIVASVIGLAHGLGRRVVAEGVETWAQLQALKANGCDVAQGFLISKAIPAARVPHFVSTWSGFREDASSSLPAAS